MSSFLIQFEDIMTSKKHEVENLLRPILDNVDNNIRCKYNMHHALSSLADNMDDYISSHHHFKSNATMMDEQLDFLLLNLHHLSKCHAENMMFPLVTQYEILQNVCGNIKDFHGLTVNGCIKHDMVENVLPFQLMAERVGHFLWEDQIDQDSQLSQLDEDDQTAEDSQLSELVEDDHTDEDSQLPELAEDDKIDEDAQLSKLDEDDQTHEDSRLFKLARLLLKIVPIELEVMHICYTNLKASTSAEVGRFIKQLLETSPDILRECLIHLQERMVTVITASTLGARNIQVMMEFLLVILTDVPRDLIHHEKLFDLLARVGVLTREVLTLVCGLEEKSMKKERTDETTLVSDLKEKSRNRESINETNCATLYLQENIELLKEDLKHVYLKAPDSSQCCFPLSDGPLFMHLLHIHFSDLLDSNAYSAALIKEEIGLVKQDLEFIRSFFVNVEQGLYKDLRARILDVTYEAKYVIYSIIVRDNGLLHLIFSLRITIKKIKLIKEDISNCEGLPLVADLITGVISGREKKKTVWLEIQTNLNSFILNSEVEAMMVIELSYDHLSDHLKPCLLYLARYSKDTRIIISALIDFWCVEGLVEQTESVEEVMKVYLDNVISSSLVIIFNEIGEYPSCQLHDLVHDFCLIKARKEKLFFSISSSAPSSSSDLMPHIVTIDYHSEIFGTNNFVLFSSNKKWYSGERLYSLKINVDKLDDHLSDTFHLKTLEAS